MLIVSYSVVAVPLISDPLTAVEVGLRLPRSGRLSEKFTVVPGGMPVVINGKVRKIEVGLPEGLVVTAWSAGGVISMHCSVIVPKSDCFIPSGVVTVIDTFTFAVGGVVPEQDVDLGMNIPAT